MLNKRRQIPKKYLLNDLACIKFKNRPNSSTVKEIRTVVDYAQGARGRRLTDRRNKDSLWGEGHALDLE